jgi:hypothetical protein
MANQANQRGGPARTLDAGANQAEQDSRTEQRSGYGQLPGGEFPSTVYRSVILAFVALLPISWVAFARDEAGVLSLGFATVLTVVLFALPVIVFRTARRHCLERPKSIDAFLASRVEIATGSLTGAEAWLQVLIIPLVLLLAALLIGAVHVLVA